jgi:putative intracellular protease/amidase
MKSKIDKLKKAIHFIAGIKIVMIALVIFFSNAIFAQHNAGNNGKVLLIASNPSVSKQTGWPIGVWAAEVVHPYWEFSNAGYTVDIASPDGGEIKIDGFSDPEDASKYAAWDYLSLGFLKDPAKSALMKTTLKLSSINPKDYKGILVCGGQGPMYTFIDNVELHKFFVDFYQTGKPTAAICHGTAILLKTKLPNGKFLVDNKKWTGFANSEENYADAYVGQKIQPFRIEDEARKMSNSKFEVAPMFEAFAVEDGNLITGQQQNSGAEAAKLVIKQLNKNKSKYPTYILVHGAWADESAWGFVRNELAKNANVVVVNLPAHGADNTYGVGIGLNDYVKTVTEAINKQSGKVILVGHSMAGQVISQVAENMPNKIDKLIYVAAYLPKNGENVSGITNKFLNNKPIEVFEFNKDYSLVSIKKEAIPNVVCADCPDYMKDVLVKYHRAEPTKGLNDNAKLSTKFATVPKYYISTKNDYAVPYALQQQMIKDNGTIKKVFEMTTSHLPFVVNPAGFIEIIRSIQ